MSAVVPARADGMAAAAVGTLDITRVCALEAGQLIAPTEPALAMESSNNLVTIFGGAGFIGTQLVQVLAGRVIASASRCAVRTWPGTSSRSAWWGR